jgi:hypothetical protein
MRLTKHGTAWPAHTISCIRVLTTSKGVVSTPATAPNKGREQGKHQPHPYGKHHFHGVMLCVHDDEYASCTCDRPATTEPCTKRTTPATLQIYKENERVVYFKFK